MSQFQLITRETLGVVVPATLTAEDRRQLHMQLSVSLSTLVQLHTKAAAWQPSDSGGTLITYLNADVFQQSGTEL